MNEQWSHKEKTVIRERWKELTDEQLSALLPGRTPRAVQRHRTQTMLLANPHGFKKGHKVSAGKRSPFKKGFTIHWIPGNHWRVRWWNGRKNVLEPYPRWWWKRHVGPIPPNMQVVHKDGNKKNILSSNFTLKSKTEIATDMLVLARARYLQLHSTPKVKIKPLKITGNFDPHEKTNWLINE